MGIENNDEWNFKDLRGWLHWLLLRRYTVSIGLMQVNSEMAPHFHVKPDQFLEPCTNLRIGAAILISVYTDLARETGEGFSALDVALSFYNTGNPTAGSPTSQNGTAMSRTRPNPSIRLLFAHNVCLGVDDLVSDLHSSVSGNSTKCPARVRAKD